MPNKSMFDYLKYIHRTNSSAIVFDPQDMVRELIAYGEPEAADALPKLSLKELAKIGIRAYDMKIPRGYPQMIDTAICLAIVEHLEGKSRPLNRKRRVYPRNPRTRRKKVM